MRLDGGSVENVFGTASGLNGVSIFVDYDNIYWGLMKQFGHDADHHDPSKNLFTQLWNRYGRLNVRAFRAYADFQKLKTQLTSLQQKRIQIHHVYTNGKDVEKRKNSADIELSIDAIESTYRDPDISSYVIVTADGDLVPLLSRLAYKGKRVELVYLPQTAPHHTDLTQYADVSINLVDLLGIEVKEYHINKIAEEALDVIARWQAENAQQNRVFLGYPLLSKTLCEQLSIPEAKACEAIDYLMVNNYIQTTFKTMADHSRKPHITITDRGLTATKKSNKVVYANSAFSRGAST